MAEIKTSDGSFYLYFHWDGSDLPDMVDQAVKAALPRLHDESYWVRIVVDQLFKRGRDQETGYGILLKPDAEDEYNNDKPSVIIDARDGSWKIVGRKG